MCIFWPDKPSRLIAASFANEPEKWTVDDYHARHSAGHEIWIANGSFALEVQVAGGPQLYGFFFPVGTASQIVIWRAFKRWRRDRAASLLAKP